MVESTARGTASLKASGINLIIPEFTVPSGHSLVVSAGYDNAQGAPTSVVHAGRFLRRKVQRDDTTNGFHGSIWIKGEYHRPQTGTCILTWAASIGKRAALARSFDRIHALDQSSGFISSGVNPGTGLTATLTSAECMAYCAFVAEGPLNDTGGETLTPQILDGGTLQSATLGQSDGTNGGGPITNIRITETFLQLTATNTTRGVLTGGTNRSWIGMILALKPRDHTRTKNDQAITPSDLIEVEDIIIAAGGNPEDVLYQYDPESGLWIAFEIASPGTPVATRDKNSNWSAT